MKKSKYKSMRGGRKASEYSSMKKGRMAKKDMPETFNEMIKKENRRQSLAINNEPFFQRFSFKESRC